MFNVHQPNIDNLQNYLKQENDKSSGRGTGPTWWNIPSGMSSIRVLPPWDPTGRVALPVYMHPIEYQGEGMAFKKYNWTCVNKTFNKACPICDGLASLSAAGVDISNYEANRRQFYFNAIIMHDPTYNEQKKSGVAPGTHVLLKAPKTFYDWIVAQITNPMIGDITSITNGIDVYVTKEGSGLGTSYNMTLSPNGRTPIPQEYLDKITDLYNLDDIFSAGFDQNQINGLVDHLKKSAGVMANSITNTVNQMAGYTNQVPPAMAPNPQFNQFNQMPQYQQPAAFPGTMAPNQFAGVPTPPVAPPMSNPMTPPWEAPQPAAPTMPAAPVAPAPQQSNMPKCFGQYDAGAVNCVVCPMELQCSQSKNG